MDYILDIIIRKSEIEKIGLTEKLILWGDEKFSCSPPQYTTGTELMFEQVMDVSCYQKVLPETAEKEQYLPLILKGNFLKDLECMVYFQKENLTENPLLNFMMKLVELEEFYILLVREDEVVKEQYAVSKASEIREIICNVWNEKNPSDILITKKGRENHI